MKLSAFIIALLIVGLIASILGIFYGGLGTSFDQTYDNQSFAEYESFQELQAQADEIDEKLGKISGDSGIITTTTAYISSGYTVVKTTGKSFETFDDMADEAIDQADLGKGTIHFKNYLILIAFIAFIFIIIAVLLGRSDL